MVSVILVAAGLGERLGMNMPKALVTVAGESLLAHSLKVALKVSDVAEVIIAAPDTHLERFGEIAVAVANATSSTTPIRIVAGGASRQQSIYKALGAAQSTDSVVLVHDVARPFAPVELYDRVAMTVQQSRAGVVPLLPVVDTIKKVQDALVLETVDRSALGAAQTPQGFLIESLRDAYRAASEEFTDDAALYQAAGGTVISVIGDARAFKITTQDDLARAESLFTREYRTGVGTDTHRFTADADKKLFLGTVEWPDEPGLDGHSDGDALSHAIVDSLLSAAGLGDIGSNFGVDRPEFAGANGEVFLAETKRILDAQGWKIENVATQIIGNRPKVGPHRERVQLVLSGLLQAPVTIGATTTDGLGFLGNSEGVAAVANALISRPAVRLNS